MDISPENFGQTIDPYDGLADIKKGLLRTPLEPEETFSDDPLRIMRAIRFATQLEFSIDAPALEAIARTRDRLKIISQERISMN